MLQPRIGRFRSNQYLIREFDVSDDVTDWATSGYSARATGTGKVTLSGTPNYSAMGGELSFRHPYGKRGNFLCFDARVETLTPTDDVYSTRTAGMPQ